MIKVRVSDEYDVIIGAGLLKNAGELVAGVHEPCKVMLVTDSTVDAIYGGTVTQSMKDAGYGVSQFIIEPGEQSKSAAKLVDLWEALANEKLTRTDMVIALGGGVVGDLAGFAAATYLRGIACIQLPTTLLAMVDSSVGGKTAVDLSAGKNLAGAFHRPSLVLCDTDALATLPAETYADGMAEVIKYGMINSPQLLDMLENDCDIREVIRLCAEDKKSIVNDDEFDNGSRRLLNFGHTLGHGIEKLSGYRVTHGSAVAVGMLLITRASVNAGVCPSEVCVRLEGLLKKYSLPTQCEYSAQELCRAALQDKKRQGDLITLVLPCGNGETVLADTPVESLCDFVSGAWAE